MHDCLQNQWKSLRFNPLNPKSDQDLISPYINITKPFMKIMRIKEMITNLRIIDPQMNSPCQ